MNMKYIYAENKENDFGKSVFFSSEFYHEKPRIIHLAFERERI